MSKTSFSLEKNQCPPRPPPPQVASAATSIVPVPVPLRHKKSSVTIPAGHLLNREITKTVSLLIQGQGEEGQLPSLPVTSKLIGLKMFLRTQFPWLVSFMLFSLLLIGVGTMTLTVGLGDDLRILGDGGGGDGSRRAVKMGGDGRGTLRPIIGILAQEEWKGQVGTPAERSYIAASYVKFIEGAGARVVPIMINQDHVYYKKMFKSINGLLLPGGSVNISTSGYGSAGLNLFNLAQEANKAGDFFPIWGTCLGFEFLTWMASGGLPGTSTRSVLTPCGAYNTTDKLKFTKESQKSQLFGTAPKAIVKSLSTQQVTVNFHHQCVSKETIGRLDLERVIKVLSWNFDKVTNLQYVSSFEFQSYPFYGVQFHPEKNVYEWTRREVIPHSEAAIEIAQYFAGFFVHQARKNNHSFGSLEEETASLIFNYSPEYTGKTGSSFEQIYTFPINNGSKGQGQTQNLGSEEEGSHPHPPEDHHQPNPGTTNPHYLLLD